MAGNVNTRGLLATAAALTGCPAGFRDGSACLRVSIDGEALPAAEPGEGHAVLGDGDTLQVWLERDGPGHANDALVLERLLLAAASGADATAATSSRGATSASSWTPRSTPTPAVKPPDGSA